MKAPTKFWVGKKRPEHADTLRRKAAQRREDLLHGVDPETEVVPGLKFKNAPEFIKLVRQIRNSWTGK